MVVTFEECHNLLVACGGAAPQATYISWTRRPGYRHVVEFVKAFSHEHLFSLSPADIQKVLKTTAHALGNVPKEHQIPEIEDFTCPFALQHLFHRFVERTGDLPTWQRFWRWMTHQAKPHWLDQLEPLRGHLRTKYANERIDDAIQWRVGKFYYSAVREVDLLVSLHAMGVPLKYHILADVLLRVDYWIENRLICIYFPNPRYRSGTAGRKSQTEKLFAHSETKFTVVNFPIERQGFGKTWLVSDRSKERLANCLSASPASEPAPEGR